jgi:hypothetical protein
VCRKALRSNGRRRTWRGGVAGQCQVESVPRRDLNSSRFMVSGFQEGPVMGIIGRGAPGTVRRDKVDASGSLGPPVPLGMVFPARRQQGDAQDHWGHGEGAGLQASRRVAPSVRPAELSRPVGGGVGQAFRTRDRILCVDGGMVSGG